MKNIPLRKIGNSQTEPQFAGNFSIRKLSQFLGGKALIHELHRHDYYYILVIEKGKGNHEIDFISYTVRNHSVFFLRPGQVHQLRLEQGSEGYLMQFDNGFFYMKDPASVHLLRRAGNTPFCSIGEKNFDKLNTVLSSISREYTEKETDYQEIIKSNLRIFFIELLRHRKGSPKKQSDISLYRLERLEDFLALLEKNLTSHKKVSHYADMMNMSVYQLNSITKSLLGKTCSDLINDAIILEARRYLLATSNQVNQIADQLGYDDVSYFIRFFKKHTGHSPESFRYNFK